MRALSIRQPFAELILRGMKTIEYRSRSTRIVGERFWIYASKKWAGQTLSVASGQLSVKRADNIVLPAEGVPPWMAELANGLRLFPQDLPTGVIVGSAVIERVVEVVVSDEWSVVRKRSASVLTTERSSPPGGVFTDQRSVGRKEVSDGLTTDHSPLTTLFHWHLTDVERVKRYRRPTRHPQPVWFQPF